MYSAEMEPVTARRVNTVKPENISITDNKVQVSSSIDRAMIYGLTAFGLLTPRSFKNVGGAKWTVFAFYSTFVLILLGSNVLRMAVTVREPSDGFTASTFQKMVITGWMFIGVSNVCFYIRMSFSRRKGIAVYYDSLSRIVADLKVLRDHSGEHDDPCGFRVAAWCCIAAGWLMSLFASTFTIAQLIHPEMRQIYSQYCRLHIGNGNETQVETNWGLGMVGLAFVWGPGVYIWPALHIVLVGLQMEHILRSYQRSLKRVICLNPSVFLREVDAYRQVLRRIEKVIQVANHCLGPQLMVHTTFQLFGTMVTIYSLMWSKVLRGDPYFVGITSFWLCLLFGFLVLECVISARVYCTAEKLAGSIHLLRSGALTLDSSQILSIHLLIDQTHRPMGFEPLNVFALNKDALLTVASTWLTYFLIILSFNPSQD